MSHTAIAILWFVVGLFIGVNLGVLAVALLSAAADAEEGYHG